MREVTEQGTFGRAVAIAAIAAALVAAGWAPGLEGQQVYVGLSRPVFDQPATAPRAALAAARATSAVPASRREETTSRVGSPAMSAGAAGPRGAAAVWELSDLDTPPRAWSIIEVARLIAAHYPAEARRAERSGRVVVEMIVGADGLVERESVTATQASSEEFVEAAKLVAAGIRFTPARAGRGTVRARVVVPVAFAP